MRDRLVATVRYSSLVSATNLSNLESGTTAPTASGLAAIRPTSNAADRWDWRVYDNANRLIQTIDGAGAVVTYVYDGASRLVSTTASATALVVTSFKTTPPTTQRPVTVNAANDRTTRNFYDGDGRLIGTLDAEGYLTEIVFDAAGQRVETIRYATFTASADRATGDFATLKAGVTATVNANDIHNWFVYDGRGLPARIHRRRRQPDPLSLHAPGRHRPGSARPEAGSGDAAGHAADVRRSSRHPDGRDPGDHHLGPRRHGPDLERDADAVSDGQGRDNLRL